MRHFVQEAFSPGFCISYILWECSRRRGLKCKGTLSTDISVQNVIGIRLKYKTLIECSGLRCLRTKNLRTGKSSLRTYFNKML